MQIYTTIIRTSYLITIFTAVAIILGTTNTPAFSEKINDPAFMPYAKDLFEAFLRRPLTAAEWEQAQNDGSAKFDGDLNKVIDAVKAATQTLREEDGKPPAIHIRHRITMGIVFDPATVEAPTSKLLLSLDPVVAIDIRQKRLMTFADVRALFALRDFLSSNADPNSIALGKTDEVLKLSATLRKSLQKGSALPELHTEAAALWAGIQQEWSSLSAREQGLVREYVKLSLTKGNAMLPDELYVKLIGWSQEEVIAHQNAVKMAKISQQFRNSALEQSHMLEMQTLVHETWMINKTIESFSIPHPPQ